MSKGAVLCRPPQPVTMTRDPSLSMLPQPAPPHPAAADIWPDSASVATPSPRHRRCWDKQSQQQQKKPGLHFLRSCATCRRRLSPDRDVYIYRGDIGFCSPECRERRIRLDDQEATDQRYYC